jgi:hypothetical protein
VGAVLWRVFQQVDEIEQCNARRLRMHNPLTLRTFIQLTIAIHYAQGTLEAEAKAAHRLLRLAIDRDEIGGDE